MTVRVLKRLFVPFCCVGVLLALPTLARAESGETFESRIANADEALVAGDLQDAVTQLDALVLDFPQDPAVHIRRAYALFLLARYAEAESSYLKTSKLNPESLDAHLGLGWCALRQGRKSDAMEEFRWVEERSSGYSTVEDGIEAARPRHHLGVVLFGGWQKYSGNPYKSSAVSGGISVPMRFWDHWDARGTYRFSRYTTQVGTGYGASLAGSSLTQHEGFATLGYSGKRLGAWGHYGYLDNDLDTDAALNVVGLSAQATAWADFRVRWNASLYDEYTLYRTAAMVSMPLGGGVRLHPAFAWQRVEDENLYNTSLGVSLVSGGFTAWLSGKYGVEFRPAYLANHVVYNTPDRLTWGAFFRTDYTFEGGFGIGALYEFNRLRSDSASVNQYSNMHVFLLEIHWFGEL